MTDLSAFPDAAVLTTKQVADWLGCSRKAVLRMPLTPLNIKTRERRYLAGDVKSALQARRPDRSIRKLRGAA